MLYLILLLVLIVVVAMVLVKNINADHKGGDVHGVLPDL